MAAVADATSNYENENKGKESKGEQVYQGNRNRKKKEGERQ